MVNAVIGDVKKINLFEAKKRPELGDVLYQRHPRFIYLLGLFLSTLHQPSKLKSLESELIQPKRETI